MLRLIQQLDAEKEGFTKRCEAQLKRLKKEKEEKKHLKEEEEKKHPKEEEEVRRFGDDNEDERRREHPEVIELLSDDDE
jgi:hypothetical protein